MSAGPSLPPLAHAFGPSHRAPGHGSPNALPPIRSNSFDERPPAVRSDSQKRTNSDEPASDLRKRTLARHDDEAYRTRYSSDQRSREDIESEQPSPPPVAPRGSSRSHTLPHHSSPSLSARAYTDTLQGTSTSNDRPHKRRRTANGHGAPDRPPSVPSSPVSPMTSGFSRQSDEQSRLFKDQHRALAGERRGSTAGVVDSPRQHAQGMGQGSLNSASSSNRRSQQQQHPIDRNPSPPPKDKLAPIQSSIPLPPPPTSFTRRRAMAMDGEPTAGSPRKRAPADIVISPRSPPISHSRPGSMAMSTMIQSAPAVPRPGQLFGHAQQNMLPRGLGLGGGGAIALPAIPPLQNTGGSNRRILPAPVPPTPTRLSALGAGARPLHARAGTTAHIAISNTLSTVPPTPTGLRHRFGDSAIADAHTAGSLGDKAAFLAPFETFYDALVDARQLKTWLAEQLTRSNALMEKMQENMDDLVQKRVAGLSEEVAFLKRRVGELEGELAPREGRAAATLEPNKNGLNNSHVHPTPPTPQNYTFPASEPHRPSRSESREYSYPLVPYDGRHREPRYSSTPDSQMLHDDNGRRHSVSSIRLDPAPQAAPRPQAQERERDRDQRDWHAKRTPHNSPHQPPAPRPNLKHSTSSSSLSESQHRTSLHRHSDRPAPSEHHLQKHDSTHGRSRPQSPMDTA